jgi:histidinol dehydrogenase
MIVADKVASLEKANEIASKLLSLIIEESKKFNCDDDPAEQIYLGCHIIGSLLAKLSISLENFGKIYAIPNMTTKSINEWINLIAGEHILINKELSE